MLSDPKVRAALTKFVNLKLDGSDSSDETFKALQKKYKIVGFPTYLLIDPQTGQELARWGSELYDVPTDQFIEQMANY